MSNLSSFLSQFRKRGGFEVFFSGFGTKIISLIVAIVVARLLTVEEFGLISYALLIIVPLITFSGGGMDLALQRFGSIAFDRSSQDRLFLHSVKIGFRYTLLLIVLLWLTSGYIALDQKDSVFYIRLLSLLLLFEFFLRMIQSYLRISEDNRSYALTGITRSIALLLFSVSLIFFSGAKGYAVALILSPAVVALYFYRNVPKANKSGEFEKPLEFSNKEMQTYGLFVGFGSIISQFHVPLAGILLGNLSADTDLIALYKVSSIIPVSLLFLPDMFFKSEFVHLAKNFNDKELIFKYFINYWKISLTLCFVMLLISFCLGDFIITTVFSEKYREAAPLFKIFIVGLCGAYLLRQPFGNLTTASGYGHLNVVSGVVALIVGLILTTLLINEYGVYGAVLGTTIMFWISGLINITIYYFLYTGK